MRAPQGAHSVAAMRLSLPSLTAAVGATAAVLAAAAPAEGAGAIFGGTAKGGAPIVVRADAKLQTLQSIVVSWDAPCSDGRYYGGGDDLTPAEAVPGFSPGPRELLVERNAKGKFSGAQVYSSDLGSNVSAVQVQVSGKLTAKRSSGTLSAIAKIADKATGAEVTSCQTGTVKWVAVHDPGVIYGGATSQSEPIVLRLSADRARVNDVLTTWGASCGEAGYWHTPDHFVNFALKRTGRFGNPFSDDTGGADGSKVHYDYAIAGLLRKSNAKGALRVKVTETDPAGAVSTCDSGNVTWKAATG
jgi:hypothetical protein